MKITKQALLDRGFEFSTCTYHGIVSDNYILRMRDAGIEIYGDNFKFVDLVTIDDDISVPNCRTLKQLDALMDLFKE